MSTSEVPLEERFQFGENWARFLRVLNDDRIAGAERSFVDVLGLDDLSGLDFLDIGSGSGLSSLVARRLGARVHSFDFDPNSVACTQELRRRYFPDDPQWTVERGSALDPEYGKSLGQFDIVYSWGVLHHTGDMWKGIELALDRVKPDGLFFVALYNDRGWESRMWWHLKRLYVALPRPLQAPYAALAILPYEVRDALGKLVRGRPLDYVRSWKSVDRGMNRWRDIIDWVGGYPYEAVSVESVTRFAGERGFTPVVVRETRGLGCHEMVYRKNG
ncbi:MAG: class I SAM-dependent methyltransferase [Gemmatimonadota bacterium]